MPKTFNLVIKFNFICTFTYNTFIPQILICITFIVTEFSKKTGDYASLSATDIKVIALTYRLEKEKVGTDHLRTDPIVKNTVDSNANKDEKLCTPVAGFYMPEKKVNAFSFVPIQ